MFSLLSTTSLFFDKVENKLASFNPEFFDLFYDSFLNPFNFSIFYKIMISLLSFYIC